MLYGAELLSLEARKPFVEVDEKLTNKFITKLLKIGQTKLARKHQLRVQLALGIPILNMDMNKIIESSPG